jgi:membrane-bound lytic murein transglycosylase A
LNPAKHTALLFLVSVFLFSGCGVKSVRTVSSPTPQRKSAKLFVPKNLSFLSTLELVPKNDIPSFSDDLDRDSLNLAVERSLQYLSRLRDGDAFTFGLRQVAVKEIRETLTTFREIMNEPVSDNVKEEKIRNSFDFYQSTGDDGEGRVIFTGYYEPALKGSFTKTERYRYPLYRPPGEWKYGNNRFMGNKAGNDDAALHFTRAEIDGKGALTGKNLEMLWVDDYISLFFLHIQGSGKVELPDGGIIRVGYAQSNGYPYRSIANNMIENGILTRAGSSQQAIRKYLEEHPEEAPAILSYNERYVFFRIVESGPHGALDVPVTAGRTIASDPDVFPKGALALIRARKPVIEKGSVISWAPFSRFVLNQDAGNAIKGPGRIDIFCGSGDEALEVAGRLKEAGELFFLIKK